MRLRNKFSDDDLGRIKAAVKKAEEKISGEIVPVMVEQSDDYPVTKYRAGLVLATLVFIFMIILDRFLITDASLTLYYDPLFIFVVVVAGGALGSVFPDLFPPVKRMFLSRKYMEARCQETAANAFLDEEIFNTRHRTGIMIFISFFEHEVIVMADRGISKVVEQKEWDNIVSELAKHIRAGKLVEGLEGGLQRCGEILLERGFHKSPDDINELRDDLRIN